MQVSITFGDLTEYWMQEKQDVRSPRAGQRKQQDDRNICNDEQGSSKDVAGKWPLTSVTLEWASMENEMYKKPLCKYNDSGMAT